jgi:aminoglycoside 6'-N-acetyltransferase
MHTPPQGIELRAFVPERDLPLVSSWLKLPHVSRWWGDPADSEKAVREHHARDSALICLDAVPKGYLCWQVPTRQELELVGLADLPADVVDIDIFIGELSATGRGLGSEALNQLCCQLRRNAVALAGIAASPENAAACRAYEKAGFRCFRPFREAGQDWNYLTKALNAAA